MRVAEGNYLRARGEYQTETGKRLWGEELPPRTRRILKYSPQKNGWHGTTSAHAENTEYPSQKQPTRWNYLRARGEYLRSAVWLMRLMELPPRTRRILNKIKNMWGDIGTTSAHAENTRPTRSRPANHRNYLRARGEYRIPRWQYRGALGTTSAHAENTGVDL